MRHARRAARSFSSLADYRAYLVLRYRDWVGSRVPVVFHPKGLGGHAMLCRPATTDCPVLFHTLIEAYQMPPEGVAPRWIIDLGANVGYTAAFLASRFPDAQVCAVEMDPANAALARQNTRGYGGRVKIIEAAVWSYDGHCNFAGEKANAFRVVRPGAEETAPPAAAPRRVRAMTMESIFHSAGMAWADYVKVDIEGAEDELFLSTSPGWLERVGSLKIEVHTPNAERIRRVLERRGFACRLQAEHWNCLAAVRRQTARVRPGHTPQAIREALEK
jgi:FkbM family methyltransferase